MVDLERILLDGAAELGIDLSANVYQFFEYMNLLKIVNNKMNLTAITEDAEIIRRHFLDSLTIIGAADFAPGARVVDIGSGAGFPGIPLALARPDIHMLLLDSLNKRVNFLTDTISKLNIVNTMAIHGRAEDMGRQAAYRENFDFALSRAVAEMAALAEYCLPFVKIGGAFIAMKGTNCADEIATARPLITALGGEIAQIHKTAAAGIPLSLITIHKTHKTPENYPRRPKSVGRI
ncbi:MAG: 16S rRNA (guanine(527)-N(7))-methyltransferase RsmG [Defluviitaleaceae bacterium]|nr:16S rRNA (guanine(527)-N(7))-methyltransferase RsmG [Defluviitaleaceae bacterium]